MEKAWLVFAHELGHNFGGGTETASCTTRSLVRDHMSTGSRSRSIDHAPGVDGTTE